MLLSPCIAPGTVDQPPYNHYTMLGSIENLFGLSHLGYAQLPGETYFGADIFDHACPPTATGPPGAVALHAPALASASSTGARIPVRWGGGSVYTVPVRSLSARGGHWRRVTSPRTSMSLRWCTPGVTALV
ncbi:MAG TPA: hypothetical protein VHV28_03455 [Solirubrobacteraceae bacterium]|nr:hypothetical protein [Solirubrobacteraceae bacterium]